MHRFTPFVKLLLLVGLLLKISSASAVNLTVADIKNGQLPSNHHSITLRLWNGNWVRKIMLPIAPSHAMRVTIASNASFPSSIHHANFDFDGLELRRRDSFSFQYNVRQKKWFVDAQKQTPNSVGNKIDNTAGQKFIKYVMYNGDWTKKVFLPDAPRNLRGIIIESSAAYPSSIDHSQLLTKSSTNIRANRGRYVLLFNKNYKKWQFKKTPIAIYNASHLRKNTIPAPIFPNTKLVFGNGNYSNTVQLPAYGNEGDKMTLESYATFTSMVSTANTNLQHRLPLSRNDTHTFIYRKDRKHWSLTNSTAVKLNARNIPRGRLSIVSPKTEIYFSNGNYVPHLQLPGKPSGYSVSIKTNATLPFLVSGPGLAPERLYKGELVDFVVDQNGSWRRDTSTIDVLAIYSHKNVEKIGARASRQRLKDGLNLTNEALKNSGAKFRYRMVGLKQFQTPSHWKSLNYPLIELRDHAGIQSLRDSLRADLIYYEGTESGCGLAWAPASAYNSIASGSLNCGITVMRHEIGHNMGLHHGIAEPYLSTTRGVGYSKEGTVMGGNAIPYFSTPERISPLTNLPLGFVGRIDAVSRMNEHAKLVANFR